MVLTAFASICMLFLVYGFGCVRVSVRRTSFDIVSDAVCLSVPTYFGINTYFSGRERFGGKLVLKQIKAK